MDKFKEKLNALRLETDSANSRAAVSEESLKKVQASLQAKENEILSLQNKIILLSSDLEKAETRIGQVKLQKQENDAIQNVSEQFQRRLSILETDVETSKRQLKEATEKWVFWFGLYNTSLMNMW